MTPEQQREAVRLLRSAYADNRLPGVLAAPIDAFLESLKDPTPPRPTVRVRAAVAVSKSEWSVSGFFSWTDKRATDSVLSDVSDDNEVHVHFIEADIPLPQPETITAEVVDG